MKTMAEALESCYGQRPGETPDELTRRVESTAGIKQEMIDSKLGKVVAAMIVANLMNEFTQQVGPSITKDNIHPLLINAVLAGLAHGAPVGIEMEKAPL